MHSDALDDNPFNPTRTPDYDTYEQCVLDIIANTDVPYHAARMAADKVYNDHWVYDTRNEVRRSVQVYDPHHPRQKFLIQLIE